MLYRAYGAGDRLLYVGISQNIRSRITDHCRGAVWWDLVVKLELTIYPDRGSLEEAERTGCTRTS